MSTLADDVHLASQIAAHLIAAGIDDEDPHYAELMASETDIQDRLRRIIRASRFVAADAKALGEMMAEMRDRKARLERKVEALRETVAWAMSECGLKKLESPDFTASLGAGKPKVIITNADLLPDEACVIKRELSKAAIAIALAEGPLPGAELSNPEPTLTVRVR